MIVYARRNMIRLYLLRFGFLALVWLCYYLFTNDGEEYGYIISFFILCGAVFPVTTLLIAEDFFRVRQYFFYGFIWRTVRFEKDDRIEVFPHVLEISDTAHAHTDEWWDAFFIFVTVATARFRKYLIKKTDITGEVKRVNLKLIDNEYQLIERWIASRIKQ